MWKITCFTDEKRHRVYVQSVSVCSGTTGTCVSTCARGAGTHGDVLNLRTEVFFCVPSRATHHTTHTTQHNTTQHHTTRRQRQRDTETEKTGTEREEKTEEERQDKRREDKRRQDKTREERRFIFSVVMHGRFLLME